MKRCANPACQDRPFEDFNKFARSKDGYAPRCRDCTNEDRRRRHAKNPEPHRAEVKAYQRANPDKRAVWSKRWREKNPDYGKRHYTNNRAAYLQKAAEYKARLYSATVETVSYIEVCKRDRFTCYMCGVERPTSFHIDHLIPLSRDGEHSYKNVGFACAPCNLRKSWRLPNELPDSMAKAVRDMISALDDK